MNTRTNIVTIWAVSLLTLSVIYLFWGTGLHCDDIERLVNQDVSLRGLLTVGPPGPANHWLLNTSFHTAFDCLQIVIFREHFLLYDLVKSATSLACIGMTYVFAKDAMSRSKALLFASLFVLYPTHDTANYNTISTYAIVTPSLLMLAHHWISKGRFRIGVPLCFLGAFWSYASPPYGVGLSAIFLARRQYTKFWAYVTPQLIFVLYYVTIAKLFGGMAVRMESAGKPLKVIKQILVQVASFLDVAIGPSFWLKLYYSASSLTIVSLGVAVFVILLFLRYFTTAKASIERPLWIGFASTLGLSFCMFALTGAFPQVAFNLGNRVAVSGSLFMAYVVVSFLTNRRLLAGLVVGGYTISILGLSDHWKSWETERQIVFHHMRENQELRLLDPAQTLFISGHQYSRLGFISHIEFLQDAGDASAVFFMATGVSRHVVPLNNRMALQQGELVDRRYGSRLALGSSIVWYDSTSDVVRVVPTDTLDAVLRGLPSETRHWIQLLDKDNPIRKATLVFMPRVAYAFE